MVSKLTGRQVAYSCIIGSLLIMLFWRHSSANQNSQFQAVSGFDLTRYSGTWFEIARMPSPFEDGLDSVTATYGVDAKGKITVFNQGTKKGKPTQILGKAKFAKTPDIGHLKVSFFGPFYSDYIILELDSAYQYALVSGADHKLLWILSRTSTLDQKITARLLLTAGRLGFKTGDLIWVKQGN